MDIDKSANLPMLNQDKFTIYRDDEPVLLMVQYEYYPAIAARIWRDGGDPPEYEHVEFGIVFLHGTGEELDLTEKEYAVIEQEICEYERNRQSYEDEL